MKTIAKCITICVAITVSGYLITHGHATLGGWALILTILGS